MPMNTLPESIGDLDALKRLERFGGLKLRAELTTLFLQEAPTRLTKARTAVAAGDVDAVRAMAHMLKSSAGQMGAVRVQYLCERLEAPELPPDLAGALSELDEELARYSSWLETTTTP
ncbi:MAG TPA: Hpt domain-containing protein [Gemmatimonadaceae bacterium]|jgi:HPt (histidine-containing phosphotransfer) domain-containing protein|nr:Hpt domain-containing protein [Gemmatimonadaceae bacterium]